MLAIDRAGVVGGDGPTHAGAFDVTCLRCLPNIVIMTPADENETRRMLCTGFLHEGPSAVRYPRGAGPGVPVEAGMEALPIGKAEERRRGSRIAFLSFGPLLHHVMEVAEELDATVFNMRFVKPLDEDTVLSLAGEHELLVTVEENAVGGAGGAVSECLAANGVVGRLLHIGLPDRFIQHGGRGDMLTDAGLDAAGIARSVDEYLAGHDPVRAPQRPGDGTRPVGRTASSAD